MRLWHKSLIPALPREQLVAQWRELSAITGNILTKGTPNHILVNKIMDYPLTHFIIYAKTVREEMTRRGYRTTNKVWDKISSITNDDSIYITSIDDIYQDWMNSTYLTICYYNLYEKFLCGGITDEDWGKIRSQYNKLI